MTSQHSSPTQAQMVLEALQRGDKITAINALSRFGVFRLAARIHELKKLGHDIQSATMKRSSGKRYSVYWLEDDGG